MPRPHATKSPNPTDKHVGDRIRMRRMMLKMSQTKLGEAIGLTFQQVQKYEKGTNRVSASRLQQVAQVLQVPISFFFEDPLKPGVEASAKRDKSPDYVSEFLTTTDGLALAKAFTRIRDARVRRSVVKLVEEIAGEGLSSSNALDVGCARGVGGGNVHFQGDCAAKPLARALAKETQQQTNLTALLFVRSWWQKLFFVPGSKIDVQHIHTIRKA